MPTASKLSWDARPLTAATTTTPFDMVVRNGMDRFSIAIEAIRRSPRRLDRAEELTDACLELLNRHELYIREHLDDMPEVRG